MQKLGMILDKVNNSHEFWLLNFEQIMSFILVVLEQATIQQCKEMILLNLDRTIQQ